MKIDSNLVLAIIAFAAVISPIFVALSNNYTARVIEQGKLSLHQLNKQAKLNRSADTQHQNSLISFTAAANDIALNPSDFDAHAALNKSFPDLLALLDSDKQGRVTMLYGHLNLLTGNSPEEEWKSARNLVQTFNGVLPEFQDYISSRPAPAVPTAPKLHKAFGHWSSLLFSKPRHKSQKQ